MTASVEGPPTTEPVVTLSAKAREGFKRAVGALRVKLYHPNVPKHDRSESSDNDNDPVWRSMLFQLSPWICNPKGSNGDPEAVWNPLRVPVVNLKLIAKALEKEDQGKDKTKNAGRNKIPPEEHLEDVKIPSKTWDNVDSHASTLRNERDQISSDDYTTMSRQGE